MAFSNPKYMVALISLSQTTNLLKSSTFKEQDTEAFQHVCLSPANILNLFFKKGCKDTIFLSLC